MAKAPKPSPETASIEVGTIGIASLTVHILGTRPMLCNALSRKAIQELLLPKGKKSTAERATSLKHNPVAEFRDSMSYLSNPAAPTMLAVPASAFKKALSEVALRVPGSKKKEISQLCWIAGQAGVKVPLWGIPLLHMAAVRSADMNKTPDIRTRAMLDEWCCSITIEYATPNLNASTVAKLLDASGLLMGVGDFRQEKGAGSFGQFRIVAEDDPTLLRLKATAGRAAQIAAIERADPADEDSGALLTWFHEELERRGQTKMLATKPGVFHAAMGSAD